MTAVKMWICAVEQCSSGAVKCTTVRVRHDTCCTGVETQRRAQPRAVNDEHRWSEGRQEEVMSPPLAPSADGDLATVHNVPVDATCERPPMIDFVSPTRLQVWRVVSADLMDIRYT